MTARTEVDALARTEADAVAALAVTGAAAPIAIDGDTLYAVILATDEGGQRLEYVDREDALPQPLRARGTFRPATVHSLTSYLKTHLEAHPGTTIWVDRTAATVTAILNDHHVKPATAGWGDYKAILTLERTPEWLHWKNADGRLMGQEEFAEHIQQGLDEIIDPEAATMLEVAQSVQGTTDATWRTAKRLDNGEVGFEYSEAVAAQAGPRGSLEIPSQFVLSVVPFYGEELEQVTARLRYRVSAGRLTIGYQLIQPHKVELEALHSIVSTLEDDFPAVYMGQPRP